jgi:hypothetical protein
MMRQFVLCATLLSALLLTGCARIRDFTVAPRTACPGESVLARWDVRTGQTVLEATPPLDGLGEKPQQGQQVLSPTANTRITLKANALFTSDQREWDVVVVPASLATSFGENARCENDEPTVSFSLSEAQVSRQSRAIVVKNPYARPITIAKDGIAMTLAPKTETDRFKGMPLIGDWTVRAPVGPGEKCIDALRDVGERLIFRAQLSCAGR